MVSKEAEIVFLLEKILRTLEAMKQQEKDYWDTWQNAKKAEQERLS